MGVGWRPGKGPGRGAFVPTVGTASVPASPQSRPAWHLSPLGICPALSGEQLLSGRSRVVPLPGQGSQ